MIHYTCDRCKRTIDPETESRYVVEIDVRLAREVEPHNDDPEDIDQLAELHDQLQREMNAELASGISEAAPINVSEEIEDGPEQFDLCEQCHEVFVSNPLGRETAVGYGFSNN